MSEEAFALPRGGGCFIRENVAEESEHSGVRPHAGERCR